MLPLFLFAASLCPQDSAATALDAGELALEDGRAGDAYEHFLFALEHGADDALERVLETLGPDPEARALWTSSWFALRADAAGRAQPSASVQRRLGPTSSAARVSVARAAAVEELLAFAAGRQAKANKGLGERLVANWARRLALDLARQSPRLEAATRALVEPLPRTPERVHAPVLTALEKVMTRALARGDTGLGLRAARTLHGISVQAAFKDLWGPRPSGVGRMRPKAAAGMARAREAQRKELGEPWTVEDLEWLTTEEGEAFTRAHASFGEPGVALSPRGWYRVETDCGWETLLGVARTIERHHERLAGWYGEDPFVDRQGIVRIVPEAVGLEAEGAGFFWVGGFQGGDTTVMRFSQSNVEALGHGLTHELTHRFDGALFPGQPSWLTEGKAVWTGGAFGPSTDEVFVPNHANFGTLANVGFAGWGREEKLRELLEGPDEYRDNYSAGYSLYVYLNTSPVGGADGDAVFHDALHEFMESGRGRRGNPIDAFAEHFCDGRDGRPADLASFAAGFATFLAGFDHRARADWTARYTQRVPRTPDPGYVYDEPTWTWSRHRTEPFFGQDQARLAAEVLLDAGKSEDALRAYEWAWLVDGPEPRLWSALAALLPGERARDGAWVAEHALRFPLRRADTAAPFARDLNRTRALLDTLRNEVRSADEAGEPRVAAAYAADHDRLARWLGEPELGPGHGLGRSVAALDGLRHPFDPPARPLDTHGWVEDELAGFDDERAPGLWYADDTGGLHVGRRAPRSGTGKVDRSGGGRTFVRGDDYLVGGTYRIRARIQLTTAYVDARVVVGYQRRDRSFALRLSAGDALYAAGEKEEEPKFESLGWSLSGIWERDGALSGSIPKGTHNFGRERTAFDVELLIDGASVRASIDGTTVGTYHTADGRPIEGHVGFATSAGSIRVLAADVTRLERSRLAGRAGLLPPGLDLEHARAVPFDTLENRPVWGVPVATNGTLVVWVPALRAEGEDALDADEIARAAVEATRRLGEAVVRTGATQPIVVCVPQALGTETIEALRAQLAALGGPEPTLVEHPFASGERESPDRGRRWLVFLDAASVARVVQPMPGLLAGFPPRLQHWTTVFRDHGRPQRPLPAIPAPGDDGEEDE